MAVWVLLTGVGQLQLPELCQLHIPAACVVLLVVVPLAMS